jgi:hypothetical protein
VSLASADFQSEVVMAASASVTSGATIAGDWAAGFAAGVWERQGSETKSRMNEAVRSTEYLSYQFNGVLGIGREAGKWVMDRGQVNLQFADDSAGTSVHDVLFVSSDQPPFTRDMISSMDWWQIPLFIAVAAWALYLYSTPGAKVMGHMAKIREWWKSRRT